jgi:hypothetical protein
MLANGRILLATGKRILADGRILLATGKRILANGRIILAFGKRMLADGRIILTTGKMTCRTCKNEQLLRKKGQKRFFKAAHPCRPAVQSGLHP